MTCWFYSHKSGLGHDTGAGHPERAARLSTVQQALAAEFRPNPWVEPQFTRLSEAEMLMLGHDPGYIEKLLALTPPAMLDPDTVFSAGTLQAAVDAVKLCCQAVDDLGAAKTRAAFCAVRPPGHHAEFNKAMGFCVFNNAFIAARYAVEKAGFKQVVILDFDVHHGNGTAQLVQQFSALPIRYVSTHLHPHYPNTGGVEHNLPAKLLNVPLPFGANSQQYKTAFNQQVVPFITALNPDLLVFSAGFDAHADDPLGGMRLSADDFGWLTRQTVEALPAATRFLSVLEGGYDLEALEISVLAHVEVLDSLP